MACDPDYSVIDLLLCGWAKPVRGSIAGLCSFFPRRFPGVLGIGASAAGWQESIFSGGATCAAAFSHLEYTTTVNDVESPLDVVLHITVRITWLPGGSRFVVDITLALFTLLLCLPLANLRRAA